MTALHLALSTAANPPIDWHHATPGYTALIVVGVIVVAVGFLWRSMLKHVNKAKEPWEGDEGA
ncbi:MAG TPA: hypothetical protein VM093_07180 [Aeromicrobium sp.]|nr:hypothetical protein [Aeromicrobium sp.]